MLGVSSVEVSGVDVSGVEVRSVEVSGVEVSSVEVRMICCNTQGRLFSKCMYVGLSNRLGGCWC